MLHAKAPSMCLSPRMRVPHLAFLLVFVFMLLTGCANKPLKPDPFIQEWQQKADTSRGYSPSTENMGPPETRTIISHKPSVPSQRGSDRGLPSLPVTLKLHNVDVSIALRSLAVAADVNIMLTPNVKGTVSINVKDTSWSDVFRSILAGNGLEYYWQGNILQVLTPTDMQNKMRLEQLEQQRVQLAVNAASTGTQLTTVVSIRYAEANALAEALSQFLPGSLPGGGGKITSSGGSGGGGAGGGEAGSSSSIGGDGGLGPLATISGAAKIMTDPASNSVILQASEQDTQKIIKLIEALDTPRKQVHIRAHIIQATQSTALNLGVEWGASFSNRRGAAPGSTALDTIVGGGIIGGQAGLVGSAVYSFAKGALQLNLNALQSEGKINILSSPSITTMDNQMAYTESGERVPYAVYNPDDRTTTIQFQDALLRLEILPHVIDGNHLSLQIKISNDELGELVAGTGYYRILKKQTETNLVVPNGDTVVISGLSRRSTKNNEQGLPLFYKTKLFGTSDDSEELNEILIFITPEILPPLPMAYGYTSATVNSAPAQPTQPAQSMQPVQPVQPQPQPQTLQQAPVPAQVVPVQPLPVPQGIQPLAPAPIPQPVSPTPSLPPVPMQNHNSII